jgi:hypothetical protein
MARNKKTPSQETVPTQREFDHGMQYGKGTALPLTDPTMTNSFTPKTVTPSRFNEFMNYSHTNGKKGE